jgi:hypothetical protein
LIDGDVASLLSGPVILMAAAAGPAGRPAVGRGSGITLDPRTGTMDLMVCRAHWPDLVASAVPGAPVAVSIVRPADYRAYQVKGPVVAAMPAAAADRAAVARCREVTVASLVALGVATPQLSQIFPDRDLVRIRFLPTELFAQSPGPGAGRSLGAVP